MRSDAKRPTAGSNRRRAKGLGRLFRGSFAGRGASAGADGSGAPATGCARSAPLALLAALCAALVLAPTAQAGKQVFDYFGNETGFGSRGGEFGPNLGDVAVNATGIGPADPGDVYVVDGGNHRVQRFDSEYNFIAAWGANVTRRDEAQTIEVDATAGTYTLTLGADTTTPIAYDASSATVDNALDVLPSVGGDANVAVSSSGPAGERTYFVNFRGALLGTDVPELTADTAELTGTVEIETVEDGKGGSGSDYEICTEAAECGPGIATGGNGTIAGNGAFNDPRGIAVDPDTGYVYVAERGNRRVSVYEGDGTFKFTFGFAVNATVAGTGYEVCPATDVCTAGASGSGAGQIGSSLAHPGIAISPPDGNAATGTLYVADPGNNRVNTYEPDGTVLSSFGSSAVFGSVYPQHVAVDSRGIVYASNSRTAGQLERYDSQGVNGPVGFLTAIHAANPGTTLDPCEVGPLLADTSFTSCIGPNGESRGTVGLEVDPDSDGAGPDADILYVLRESTIPQLPENGFQAQPSDTLVQQFGPGNAPGLADPPLASDDAHGAGAELREGSGVALDPELDRLLVASIGPAGGNVLPSAPRVFALAEGNPLPDPVPTVDPIAVHTGTTATFSGTVDPMGGIGVVCKFQYSTDQADWIDVSTPVEDCLSLDPGGGPQAVSQSVDGLHPNTHYFVRLAVTRLLSGLPYVPSTGVRAFDTDPAPPAVADVGAMQIADTSARMVGTIDPRNSPTGYVFEYGTTPALGFSTPPVSIGGGTTPITVSRVVAGLAPDSTYFFRLTATNLAGTTASAAGTLHTRTVPFPPKSPGNCPNQALREDQGSSHLPDCRAYEMVSPSDKNQGGLGQYIWGEIPAIASPDGNKAAFCTAALFGEPAAQPGTLCANYLSRRTSSGWRTAQPMPRYCVNDGQGFETVLKPLALSPDFEHTFFARPESSACEFPPLDPAAPDQSKNAYRGNATSDPASHHLVAPNGGDAGLVGGTEDFSHVVYETRTNQTLPPDSPPPGNFIKLYDWEEPGHGDCAQPAGCLTLVSKDTGGEPFETDSAAPSNARLSSVRANVSANGRRIFFLNGSGSSQELYMRENAETTLHVSASECTTECGAESSGDELVWANPAGDVAFFTSCAKLTDLAPPSTECGDGKPRTTSGHKLYRWERDAPSGNRITHLTVDGEPNDDVTPTFAKDGRQPWFLGLIGASEDGEVAYVVTAGQLVPGEPVDSGMKLYRLRWNGGNPSADYLAPYQSKQLISAAGGDGTVNPFQLVDDVNLDEYHRRVTPDGRYLMITTPLSLNLAGDRDDDMDAYRWSEADGWICASCQLPGVPSAGHVNSLNSTTGEELSVRGASVAVISDNGKRIFFSARDALVAADVNGEAGCPLERSTNHEGSVYTCQDIYQWHDGTVSLLTSGGGDQGFFLVGATGSGDNVFFVTQQALVGWDPDTTYDIYTARTGGGFPERAVRPPACEGEGCREGASEAPEVSGAGSAVFQGPGNPKAATPRGRRCPGGKLRRGKRCLSVRAIARKRCRKLSGRAKRRCVRRQARRLRRAQRRRAQRRLTARRANADRRAAR